MRSILAFLLAAIAIGILAYYCIGHHAPLIANDLQARAGAALTDGNHAFASVEKIDGRDVSLVGEAPNDEARIAAAAAVDKVWGVRTVVNKITVAAPPPEPPATAAYLFQASLAGGALTLTGSVPSEDARRALLSKAQSQFPGVTIKDELIVREAPPSAEWLTAMSSGMDQLGKFTEGALRMDDLAVSLSGRIKTQEAYAAADKAMQGLPAGFTAAFNATVEAAAAPASVETPAPPTEPDPPQSPPTRQEREVAQNCQREFNRAFAGSTINFDSGSANISRSSQRLLRRLATIAQGCPKARFTIAGHTDNQGDPRANMRLSQARAAAVRDALSRQGVDRRRMAARGFGETSPVTGNRTQRGRAANRRIEFLVR